MSELKFRSVLKENLDIDLFEFRKIIDKEYDYSNDMDIVIDWRAIIYSREYGITSIFPIVDKVSIEINYLWQSETDDDTYGDREFKLTIDEFGDDNLERKNQSPKDRLWLLKEKYDRKEDETGMIVKAIEIDFELKTIEVEF
jgi:hypothetical protein|tara:strand:- start:6710 stop:7135 length:426 start_codon:yes stop_codon:yes gene_type:complete